jgi:hypothetical protein
MEETNLQGESPAEAAPALPVEAETAEPAAASEPVETEQTPEEGEKPRGVQRRIDELTRNWREAERREQALLSMLQQQKAPEPAKAPEPIVEPKTLADFQYDEVAYQRYVFEQAAKLAESAVERKLQERSEREVAERRTQTFAQREADYAAKHPDYMEVTRDMSLPITREMAEIIADSEDGPAVAHYLAKNRQIAESIAKLPAVQAARELGRIEAKVAMESAPAAAPPKPQVSKAPPPPPKVEATEPAIEKDLSQMSDAEWYRHAKRLANLKQNQRKR